jgi:hypothetical protein
MTGLARQFSGALGACLNNQALNIRGHDPLTCRCLGTRFMLT